jgi:hypothetical protein
MEFQDFPKMARLSRKIIVTEKIDGTNAQVCISDDGKIYAGSRTRWITSADDNFGFAAWVEAHRDELLTLGPGRHFGEWWGAGIQRGYGLKEKRFSLFNSSRWYDTHQDGNYASESAELAAAPACCHVVPVLMRCQFDTLKIDLCLDALRKHGSYAAPRFMKPEGIVVFQAAGNIGFKKTLGKDEIPKSLAARQANPPKPAPSPRARP